MINDNFNIGTQIEHELADFANGRIQLAKTSDRDDTGRFLKKADQGYTFNQQNAIALIDLFYNSKFENGIRDNLNQRKIFMNVLKFRCEVASKQIDIDVKDFKFSPGDFANPWTSIFMQKEFHDWALDTYLGELINDLVEAFPKYGTVVVKKVGKDIQFMPLQLLKNEQTAKDLQTATYVIEEHPDMTIWEIKEMPNWNTEGFDMKMSDKQMVRERYGRVPLSWLNKVNKRPVKDSDYDTYVDAIAIVASRKGKRSEDRQDFVFFAEEVKERPYREAHWKKQHGRWLGLGTGEDLIEDQQATNIAINLKRRNLHWASKRVLQSTSEDLIQHNVLKDVPDGTVMTVGTNGQISQVDLSSRSPGEFQEFINNWENNANQNAFTYEVATGEGLAPGTPFRLGVLLSNAVNSFFGSKQERLGLFMKRIIIDFMMPQFLRDMQDAERVVSMFSDESGYEVLKSAAMQWVASETVRASLLSGKAVDAQMLIDAITPYDAIQAMFYKLPASYYKEAKYKFDLDITGEAVDTKAKMESLTNLHAVMVQSGDFDRANKVLERIAALAGEDLTRFGPQKLMAPAATATPATAPVPTAKPAPVATKAPQ